MINPLHHTPSRIDIVFHGWTQIHDIIRKIDLLPVSVDVTEMNKILIFTEI